MRKQWPRIKELLYCDHCMSTQWMTGLKDDPEGIYRCRQCGTKKATKFNANKGKGPSANGYAQH